MGVIVLLGAMLATLQQRSVGAARMARTHAVDAEHHYRAEAVVAQVANRLKKRPWEVRYFAAGPPGTGPYSDHKVGLYRDGDYDLWVQDVPLGSVPALPRQVDVFLDMRYQGIGRGFHYRLSLLPMSPRRAAGLRVEYFSRTGEDLSDPAGRAAASGDANAVLLEGEQNRSVTDEAMRRLPGTLFEGLVGGGTRVAGSQEQVPGPGDLAEALLSAGLQTDADRREATRRQLQQGIHLLGEDGDAFQELLPPMERGRFVYRAASHPDARQVLAEAMQGAGDATDLWILAALVRSRSLFTEAWQQGPASTRGQEMLEQAAAILEEVRVRLGGLSGEEVTQLGPTLVTSVHLDRARVAAVRGDIGARDEALGEAAQASGGSGIYGGSEDPDRVITAVMGVFEEEDAQVRVVSQTPLPPSGFDPVTVDEVTGFQDDPGEGWEPWPVDSGRPPDWWDDAWGEQDERDGEGGTGAPSGDVDRDGDGEEDPDVMLDGPDTDGDGVVDTGNGDDVVRECLEANCSAFPPYSPQWQGCAEDCSADGAAVAAGGDGGAGGTGGGGGGGILCRDRSADLQACMNCCARRYNNNPLLGGMIGPCRDSCAAAFGGGTAGSATDPPEDPSADSLAENDPASSNEPVTDPSREMGPFDTLGELADAFDDFDDTCEREGIPDDGPECWLLFRQRFGVGAGVTKPEEG